MNSCIHKWQGTHTHLWHEFQSLISFIYLLHSWSLKCFQIKICWARLNISKTFLYKCSTPSNAQLPIAIAAWKLDEGRITEPQKKEIISFRSQYLQRTFLPLQMLSILLLLLLLRLLLLMLMLFHFFYHLIFKTYFRFIFSFEIRYFVRYSLFFSL